MVMLEETIFGPPDGQSLNDNFGDCLLPPTSIW